MKAGMPQTECIINILDVELVNTKKKMSSVFRSVIINLAYGIRKLKME